MSASPRKRTRTNIGGYVHFGPLLTYAVQQPQRYSITSAARASSGSGTFSYRPNVLTGANAVTSPRSITSASPARTRSPYPSLGTSWWRRSNSPGPALACRRGDRACSGLDSNGRLAGACRAIGRAPAPAGSELRRFQHRIGRDGLPSHREDAVHGP